MIRALRHIEVDCDAAGCVVVGVARNGERLPLTSRLTPYVARDHALGKGEFFNCDVVHRPAEPVGDVPVRTSKWGGR